MREDDYPVTYKTDVAQLRSENAHLRARLRELQDECNRWAKRWADLGLTQAAR